MQRTQKQIIEQHVKSFHPNNFMKGVIFHDPTTAQIVSPFPFVAVIPIIFAPSNAESMLTKALTRISFGDKPTEIVRYRQDGDSEFYGFSGKCKQDFRSIIDTYRTQFFALPIHDLSTGPTPNSRYISCLTLRDCVDAVSARLNEPTAVDYDLTP